MFEACVTVACRPRQPSLKLKSEQQPTSAAANVNSHASKGLGGGSGPAAASVSTPPSCHLRFAPVSQYYWLERVVYTHSLARATCVLFAFDTRFVRCCRDYRPGPPRPYKSVAVYNQSFRPCSGVP